MLPKEDRSIWGWEQRRGWANLKLRRHWCLERACTGQWELTVYLFSQPHAPWYHIGRVKLIMLGVFTESGNQSFFYSSKWTGKHLSECRWREGRKDPELLVPSRPAELQEDQQGVLGREVGGCFFFFITCTTADQVYQPYKATLDTGILWVFKNTDAWALPIFLKWSGYWDFSKLPWVIILCNQALQLQQYGKRILNYDLVIPSVMLLPDTDSNSIILLIKKELSILEK